MEAHKDYERPIANPLIVLREEFDDWAILFDPRSGNAFGLNPSGVFIWKHFDGKHSLEDILQELRNEYDNVPAEAADHLREFARNLSDRGYIGFEAKEKE